MKPARAALASATRIHAPRFRIASASASFALRSRIRSAVTFPVDPAPAATAGAVAPPGLANPFAVGDAPFAG